MKEKRHLMILTFFHIYTPMRQVLLAFTSVKMKININNHAIKMY